ncbi:sensor histidine kinase [Actinophytocola sp.]|jgi:signal transduction histidine kinase|uniref:sensor histidine kinase n=1 Tax=Actinophytocola sp. TaxID=1872138 RepID=UPI002EDA72BC
MPRATDLRRLLLAGRSYLLHAAVALVLVFLSAPRVTPAESAVAGHVVQVWWIFSAVLVASLLIQHRWPLLALVLATIGATAHQLAFDSPGSRVEFPTLLELAVPITLYTLASRARSRRISMAALAVILVVELAVNIINPMIADAQAPPSPRVAAGATTSTKGSQQAEGARPTAPMASFSEIEGKFVRPGLSVLLAVALAFALGDGQRTRRAHLRTLQQRAADLEREQHQRVELATAAERARLSRELHDVTAHSLSMIVAQAQAAMAAQRRHPERSTQAMREVIAVGRDSLSEMRRLVGAFGAGPDQGLAPPRGIVALPALADRVRAAGTPVHLDVDGEPGNLPAVVDLSAYRIVQEALTNTLKHAGAGAQARVRLAVHAEYVDVEVTDDGAGNRACSPADHGNGLRGIAERVNLLGGALTVGPEPDGGFTVRARLPIAPTDRPQPEPIGVHA